MEATTRIYSGVLLSPKALSTEDTKLKNNVAAVPPKITYIYPQASCIIFSGVCMTARTGSVKSILTAVIITVIAALSKTLIAVARFTPASSPAPNL